MATKTEPFVSDGTTTRSLALAIGNVVRTDGDHNTAIPALTLHRRTGPSCCQPALIPRLAPLIQQEVTLDQVGHQRPL